MLNGCKTSVLFCSLILLAGPVFAAQNSGPAGQTQNNQASVYGNSAQTSGYSGQASQYQQSPSQSQSSSNSSVVPLTAQQQAAVEQAARNTLQQQSLAADQQPEVQPPRQPFPDLPPEEVDYLYKFLDHWEQQSDKVKQYVCGFRRFEYDSARVNYRNPTTQQLAAATVAFGEIRYAEPDKGSYETSEIYDFAGPPKAAGEDADYEVRKEEGGKEKWICDGRNIYEFDFENKRLYETEIPAELQGQGIVNSPIPFLFGANRSQILDRYWVRIVPKNDQTIFWLEAYPKRIEDARLYSKIEVIISQKDFLPEGMHVYSPHYDPKKNNFESRYFAFENRQINGQLSAFKDFFGHFVRPQTPVLQGWKRVKRTPLHDQAQANFPQDPGTNRGTANGTLRK